MAGTYKVKGTSIRSKLAFVRKRFGVQGEEQLKSDLKDEKSLFPLLDSSWYPFELYDRVNRAIARRFFDNDLQALQEVGAYSAEEALTTVYRAFVRQGDYAVFLRHIEKLHKTFYNLGDMSVMVSRDKNYSEIEHFGAPEYSEADLQIAAGFYVGAGQLLGNKNVSCRLDQRPDGAHFELRW
jgi:hypothetical protein